MKNEDVARELVRIAKKLMATDENEKKSSVARKLTAFDLNELLSSNLKDLKSVQVVWAEGKATGITTLEGKKFKSVRGMERALSRFDKPDIGYYKVGIRITFNDGSEFTFRYDHGERDATFTKQLEHYIKTTLRRQWG